MVTRFQLIRSVDHSGVSGTGVVADGVLWPDGSATLRWRGEHASLVHWPSSASILAVHGHGGDTYMKILDFGVYEPDELGFTPDEDRQIAVLSGQQLAAQEVED